MRQQFTKFLPFIIIIVVLAFVVLPSFVVIVNAGNVGVKQTFGRIGETTFDEGLHLKNPFTNVIRMSVRTQEYTMSQTKLEGNILGDDSIEARASDGASVKLDVTVFYRLDGTQAPTVYRQLGRDYDTKIIRPEIRSKIREVVAGYTVNEVYSSKRSEIQGKILDELGTSLSDRGIVTEDVLLRKVNLSETLYASIEEKLAAQQKAEKKDFEIEETRKEAERIKIEAEGQRDAQEIINQSLSDKYLYLKYIETLGENENVIYVPTQDGLPLFKNVNE